MGMPVPVLPRHQSCTQKQRKTGRGRVETSAQLVNFNVNDKQVSQMVSYKEPVSDIVKVCITKLNLCIVSTFRT